MEQLVIEKVDAFWKGIEGVANKRGQVCWLFSLQATYVEDMIETTQDHCDVL